MTPTADEAAFLARVCEQPDDDGPRLIYADFLDEFGDPRGAFIRVQCALAKLEPGDARRITLEEDEKGYLAQYREAWNPLRGLAGWVEWRRGFVEVVNIEARLFLMRGAELFHLAPVRHVRLLDVAGLLKPVLASPHLGRVAELSVKNQHFDDELARRLADAPQLANLRALCVERNRISDRGVEALAHSPHLSNLKALDLGDNHAGDLGACRLADSPRLATLETLELRHNEIGFGGLEVLASSGRLERLSVLGLRRNEIGHADRRYLTGAGSGRLGLRRLDLRENGMTPDHLESLCDLLSATSVEDLDLSENRLGDEGVRQLATSACLDGVRSLALRRNAVSDAGVRALAQSPHLARLTRLDLAENAIHNPGAELLLGSQALAGLRHLSLSRAGLSMRIRRALHARFGTRMI